MVADPVFSEDEDLEKVKAWWKKNGSSIIYGVLLGLAIIIGTNAWRAYKVKHSEAASALYEQMVASINAHRPDLAEQNGEELFKDYPGTGYAGMAGLDLAKMHADAGQSEQAESRLQWVMDKAGMPSQRSAAQLRLARLYLDKGDVAKAETLLQGEHSDRAGFESAYAELEGDIKLASGDRDGARHAYSSALAQLPQGSTYAQSLQMKLDDLGGGKG